MKTYKLTLHRARVLQEAIHILSRPPMMEEILLKPEQITELPEDLTEAWYQYGQALIKYNKVLKSYHIEEIE